jgi:lysozyme family protein
VKDYIETLIDHVIELEGRDYTNDPDDSGGPTKFGITLAALEDWRRAWGRLRPEDVEKLTEAEARLIYRTKYFVSTGFDQIKDPMLQKFLFDYGINSGPSAAVKSLQTVLGVNADGDFGPASRGALARVTNKEALFFAVKCERYELMLRSIGNKPANSKFAAGWSNRLDQFNEAIV